MLAKETEANEPTDDNPGIASPPEKRSRVFEYGLLPPTGNARLVSDQMRAGHQYRNRLIEIEIERRAQVMGALSTHADVAQIEQMVQVLTLGLESELQTMALIRSASRGRAEGAQRREEIRQLRAQLKELRARARDARRQIATDPGVAAKILAANEGAAASVKNARGSCGVYWGTYLLHEAAMAASRNSKMPPRLIPWTGEGKISVQLQGGIDASEIWGGDTQIQILLPPGRPGTRRRSGRSCQLRIRAQSNEHGRPIWAEFPMIAHRAVPDRARIKVATVSRRRRGTSWDWRLHLTIDESDCAPQIRTRRSAEGAVALNLGFARRPSGTIRSGYLVGSDGWETEILAQKSDAHRKPGNRIDDRAPQWTIRSLDKASAIRARRDENLNQMRAELCRWIASRGNDLPEWFTERTSSVAHWRSPGRFATLAFAWQRGWFEGGDEGYDLIEQWRIRDLHLERYETGMRTAAQRDRREGYRLLASELASRYARLIVDDTNLSTFQKSPAPDSEEIEFEAVKQQQRIAAPSELRAAMMNAFGPRRTIKRRSTNVTLRHQACGHLHDRRDDRSREQTCESCQAIYDQDANACRNLLDGWEAIVPMACAEKKPSRTERMSAARIARQAAAREAAQNAAAQETG